MANQVRIGVGVTGAKESASELDKLKDKFSKLQKQGAQGFAIGAGAAITTKALNLMGEAVGGVEHAIGGVIEAGIEGEASMQHLGTSLKANVPGWDGNTDAIERLIHTNLNFGFSADEQRDSLARLLASTHSTSKAFEVLHVAMDLARFKGISLSDATDALTKVEAGSYRILKSLGITLKDNATQTEALAAVEKVASGQAADYAATTGGKLAVAQAKFGDVMEKLGEKTLPVVTGALDLLNSALDDSTDATKKNVSATQAVLDDFGQIPGGIRDTADNLLDLATFWDGFTTTQDDARKAALATAAANAQLGDSLADVADRGGRAASSFTAATNELGTSLKDVADRGGRGFVRSMDEIAAAARADFGKVVDAADRMRDSLLADGKRLVDGYYDPLIASDKLIATQAEITKNKRILASKTATAAEKHDATVALHQLDKDNIQYLEDLASAGGSGSKLVQQAMTSYLKKLASAHGDEKVAINAEIRRLEVLAAVAYNAAQKVKSATNGGNVSSYGGGRAGGGPVSAGKTYDVGESGREKLTMFPGGGGMVTPEGGGSAPMTSGPSSGGGSSGSIGAIIIPVPANWTPSQQQAWAREATPHIAREMQRQGLL